MYKFDSTTKSVFDYTTIKLKKLLFYTKVSLRPISIAQPDSNTWNR